MRIHIIQEGDTLTAIAKQYEVEVEAIERSNQQVTNPNMIVPGIKLMIPQQSKTVQQKEQRPLKKKVHIKTEENKVQQKKRVNQMQQRRPIGEMQEDEFAHVNQAQQLNMQRKQSQSNHAPYSDQETTTNHFKGSPRKKDQDDQRIYCDCCHRPIYFN